MSNSNSKKKPLTKKQASMTDDELINRLAIEVMGWTKVKREITGNWWWVNADDYGMHLAENVLREDRSDMDMAWNPLQDWNHTMQVLQRSGQLALAGTCTMNLMNILDIEADEPAQNAAYMVLFASQYSICLAALEAVSPST